MEWPCRVLSAMPLSSLQVLRRFTTPTTIQIFNAGVHKCLPGLPPNYCELELTLEESQLLKDLLKTETVYQVRQQLILDKDTVDQRLIKIIGIFDSFYVLEHQINSVMDQIVINEAQAKQNRRNYFQRGGG